MGLLGGERDGVLSVAGEVVGRAELAARARGVAGRIGGAKSVAVRATASVDTVVAVVGGLLAGVPVVPVPPDSGPAELAHILGDSGAELLVGAGDYGLPTVPVTGDFSGGLPEPSDDATALILYTSGTTGAPKGVMVSRAAVAADLDALAEAWAWTADDVLVHGLPLFHVHGLVLGVLGALRTGSGLVHTGRPTPEAYAAAGGSLYFGVPTVWSRVVESGAAEALRGARLLVSGSAGLPAPVFDALAAASGHRAVERYGMTETLITVSARHDGERRAGQVGLPLRGVQTRLVGEHGEAVPHDGATPGELLVRTPTVFQGYLGRPEATAEALRDGWFHTGDIATIAPDGWHRIVGRASTDLIKSGGYRIGAGEIEAALLAHPAVREAAVIGTPHADLGEQVTAFVIADGVTAADLIDFVARDLSIHKRPRTVHFVDSLPRNALGKVQKKLLPS
ncbi:acyl-CoA synthetase [Actinocorallia sp. API 0066]|uniref:acyl-CoA synthetase n=1 Tax=Actinocorallia sp. API 0066 TaxID=2896846 RepID=UPI001E2AC442|nr:acyl-CoA synthetase [Actinocorallia sp. API 0066]MCD0450880.1 acyl-CoA synthetase [Actinocorallia sp. API 0066]